MSLKSASRPMLTLCYKYSSEHTTIRGAVACPGSLRMTSEHSHSFWPSFWAKRRLSVAVGLTATLFLSLSVLVFSLFWWSYCIFVRLIYTARWWKRNWATAQSFRQTISRPILHVLVDIQPLNTRALAFVFRINASNDFLPTNSCRGFLGSKDIMVIGQ